MSDRFANLLDPGGFNELRMCRTGPRLYNKNDVYIGGSLAKYGEFSYSEQEIFAKLVREGMVVVEVGANLGGHTVDLARLVGSSGSLYAFEPQRLVFQALCANLALNQCTNVHAFQAALGNAPGTIMVPPLNPSVRNNFGGLSLGTAGAGERVPLMTLDGLDLPMCHFVKIDVEGMESDVLRGATRTLEMYRPVLYVENDREEKSKALLTLLEELGYVSYWHMARLFNPDNFAKDGEDIYPGIHSVNLLCVPRESSFKVEGLRKVASVDDTWRESPQANPTASISVGFQAEPAKEACPVCAGPCHLLPEVDFNKNCEEARGKFLPKSGMPIRYVQCKKCGFAHAPQMYAWSPAEFKTRVYNDEYVAVDPDYLDARPRANAAYVTRMFPDFPRDARHLDYGGGNGLFSKLLAERGWQSVSYDPFDDDASPAPVGKFALVTAFEVFEHVPDPRALMHLLRDFLAPDGMIVFSTLVSDGHLTPGRPVQWWYAAPRNGHISLYTRDSLFYLGHAEGLSFGSFSDNLHSYWDTVPAWGCHVLPS